MGNVSQPQGSGSGAANCPSYHAAVELIGRRWNGVLLRHLVGGAMRFSELKAAIPGITDTMLTQRLRELEDTAIVSREVVNTRPVEIRYELTPLGLELSPILEAIASWSTQWAESAEDEATQPAGVAIGGVPTD